MYTASQVIPLFPTFVWVFDLEPKITEPLNKKLMAQVEAVVPTLTGGKTDTYSAQSETDLHEQADFADLNEIVVKTCDKICDELAVIYERLMITGCWLNIAKPMASHKEHAHPNNFLSVVYYVETPKGGDSITFFDPRVQNGVIVPRTRRITEATATYGSLTVAPGRLVVFPSWLRHAVEGNQGDGVRVSVAYNLHFDNCAQTMGPPLFKGNFRLYDPAD